MINEYVYRGITPKEIRGRGGTSFDPAIVRANELHPDGLIYLTDGEAEAPTIKARMPVLWVLSEAQPPPQIDHLPGRRIVLTKGSHTK